jgi:hypothetical protein
VTGVALLPLVKKFNDDAGDVSGSLLVVEAAEEDNADGLQPVLACVSPDDVERLDLQRRDALGRVRGGRTVWCRVKPEGWDTLWLAESRCKTAVMEDHGARIDRIPPVASKAGKCPGRGGIASCVERGLDPPHRQHKTVQVLVLVRVWVPQLGAVQSEPEVAAVFVRVMRGVPAAVGLEPFVAEVEHAAACLFLNKLGITFVHAINLLLKIIAQNYCSKLLLKITNINKM